MSDAGRHADRGHHIAEVIHHFLSDELGGLRPSPALPDRPAPALYFAVAAAGANATAAVAAARLAVAASRHCSAVYLREQPGQRWSAFGYLGRRGAVDAGPEAAGGERSRCGCTNLAGRRVRAAEPRNGARCTALPQVATWMNLGALTAAHLADLEGARRWRTAVGCPVAGSDGLVWCHVSHEADSSAAAAALGRLTAVCRPSRVVQMVFPADWLSRAAARPDRRCAVTAAARRRRCAARAAAAVAPVPVTTIDLGSGDEDGDCTGAVAAGIDYAVRRLLAVPGRQHRYRNTTPANSRLLETC